MTFLKSNEGAIDRVVRVIIGVVLVSLVFWGPHTAWGWAGIVPLATGIAGTCPLYSMFGIRTCPPQRA